MKSVNLYLRGYSCCGRSTVFRVVCRIENFSWGKHLFSRGLCPSLTTMIRTGFAAQTLIVIEHQILSTVAIGEYVLSSLAFAPGKKILLLRLDGELSFHLCLYIR